MKLGLVVLLVCACGGNGDHTPGPLVRDSGSDLDAAIDESSCPHAGAVSACSLLSQAGCCTGDKCAWALSTDPTASAPGLGATTCEPQGTVALGGACTILPAAQGGYDNCVGGTACVNGVCESICDNNGGSPGCDATHTCVTHDGLFANEGSTTTPAGVCELTCSPLDDNDFDNVGTELTKSGTACGSDPLEGCTATFSSSSTTGFHCFHTPAGATLLEHRQSPPTPDAPGYACAPGYALAIAGDVGGSMSAGCIAMCKPGDAYAGNPNAQLPNGVAPHACNTTDARGDFGAIPNGSADSNGEHCMYSWVFEQDSISGVVHHSPTSDSVGFCFDHTKYKYDPTGGTNDTTVVPPCAALPLQSSTQLSASGLGCVSTTLAGLFTGSKPHVYIAGWPELISR